MKNFEWSKEKEYHQHKDIPCAMDAAIESAIKAGRKPPIALLLVCKCPKCNRITC